MWEVEWPGFLEADVAEVATDEHRIDVGAIVSLESLQESARTLRASRGHAILDFQTKVAKGAHLSTDALCLLSSHLLTTRGGIPLSVCLPDEDSSFLQLARGGILFALAQRPGQVELCRNDADAATLLDGWRGVWNPNSAAFRRNLRRPITSDDQAEAALVQEEFALFKNPHLAGAHDRLGRELAENAARPWIGELLRRLSPRGAASEREQVANAASLVIRELLFNVATHPFGRLRGIPPVAPESRRSYLSMFVTRGGTSSYNRLHIVVADTGHGVVATLRPKLKRLKAQEASLPAKDVVETLLRGELPHYGHAEGFGLPRILNMTSAFTGSLTITTPDDRDGGTLSITRRGNEVFGEAYPTLDGIGTVVHATIGLRIPEPEWVGQDPLFDVEGSR